LCGKSGKICKRLKERNNEKDNEQPDIKDRILAINESSVT
jgi:hypothetical protein